MQYVKGVNCELSREVTEEDAPQGNANNALGGFAPELINAADAAFDMLLHAATRFQVLYPMLR